MKDARSNLASPHPASLLGGQALHLWQSRAMQSLIMSDFTAFKAALSTFDSADRKKVVCFV